MQINDSKLEEENSELDMWCDIISGPKNPYYQRNNKSEHSKRLRCFPDCSLKGHQSSGFCGRSIVVRLCTKLYVLYISPFLSTILSSLH